jgi:hypothetical protein
MAVALSLGAIVLSVTDRLRRRGVGPEMLLGLVAAVFISAQLALILRLPLPSFFLWAVVAAAGAATVLSFAILTEYFPKELAGRGQWRAELVPHCCSILCSIRDRNSPRSMDAPGRALSRNRLSDRFRHQPRAPGRGVDLVRAAAVPFSIVADARSQPSASPCRTLDSIGTRSWFKSPTTWSSAQVLDTTSGDCSIDNAWAACRKLP